MLTFRQFLHRCFEWGTFVFPLNMIFWFNATSYGVACAETLTTLYTIASLIWLAAWMIGRNPSDFTLRQRKQEENWTFWVGLFSIPSYLLILLGSPLFLGYLLIRGRLDKKNLRYADIVRTKQAILQTRHDLSLVLYDDENVELANKLDLLEQSQWEELAHLRAFPHEQAVEMARIEYERQVSEASERVNMERLTIESRRELENAAKGKVTLNE